MMLELPTRRGLITGLGAIFLAAPAIVRASSLMPVSAKNLALDPLLHEWIVAGPAREEVKRFVVKVEWRIAEWVTTEEG
jgi:hypothetical protein